jgi:integrase
MALPVEGEYFFWSGPEKSKLSTATGSARRTLYSLQRVTGISVHPHRFRDTFAKKVLEETGDIRVLQHLLGHASLQTTETAYRHLGPKHQERLEDALSKVEYAKRDGTTGQVIAFPKPPSQTE